MTGDAELAVQVAIDATARTLHRARRGLADYLYVLGSRVDELAEAIDPHGDARARRRQLVIARYGDHLVEPGPAAP